MLVVLLGDDVEFLSGVGQDFFLVLQLIGSPAQLVRKLLVLFEDLAVASRNLV